MALHFASQMGRASCVPTLIGAGAVVNCSVKNGKVRETRLVPLFVLSSSPLLLLFSPSSSPLPELYLHTWSFLAV